jgi:hypothetical protein
MQNIKISELVPFEKQLTTAQYDTACQDLSRDRRFDPPAKVFRVDELPYVFVRDGHHHVRAALDLGWTMVPCEWTTPPDSVQGMIDRLDEHLALRGFAAIPIQASRTKEILDDLKKDTTINLDTLKRLMEEQKRKKPKQ